MPLTPLTPALHEQYQSLFDTCQINPTKQDAVHAAASSIIAGRAR